MPPNKVFSSFDEVLRDIPDGAVIMVGGFGGPGGMPSRLLLALRDHGAKDLTIIGNTAGLPGFGARQGDEVVNVSILYANHQVKHTIASFPVPRSASAVSDFMRAYHAGETTLEVVPQGTLAERIRAGGAGIAAFYTPTGYGTKLGEGKETREFDGRAYVLELALKADYALVRAHQADPMGNLTYRGSSRNFNPIMAMAARVAIAEVDEVVPLGALDPEAIATPGIFVKRVVSRG
jgi:3-oxoadipate CoA-transferase alpha subunit